MCERVNWRKEEEGKEERRERDSVRREGDEDSEEREKGRREEKEEEEGCLTFMASSMSTGGTFSPPAVMISSLIRPVI